MVAVVAIAVPASVIASTMRAFPLFPLSTTRSSQPRAAGSPASAAPAGAGELYSPPFCDAAIEKALLYW